MSGKSINDPDWGDDQIIYSLSMKQYGGSREWHIASLTFEPRGNRRPDAEYFEEMGLVEAKNHVAGNFAFYVKRVAGYAYLNSFLADGSVGAELGVDVGDGCQRFLFTNPSKLYLVDQWKPWDDNLSTTQESMEQRYNIVKTRFGDNPAVEIRRQSTMEFLEGMPDNSLDWVYIDADHTYEAVSAELAQCHRAVKPGGIISGDDMHDGMCGDGIGKAVFEFRREHRDDVETIWLETDPFILRKVKDGYESQPEESK